MFANDPTVCMSGFTCDTTSGKCVIAAMHNFALTWYNCYVPALIVAVAWGNVLQKVFSNSKLKKQWAEERSALKN
ncbi:hypothetical protein HDV01_002325 [Terramyces sp. JEL0728]|nr:hypothetical protein HDV01_002325 [Terramyces sp. JEL0728]